MITLHDGLGVVGYTLEREVGGFDWRWALHWMGGKGKGSCLLPHHDQP